MDDDLDYVYIAPELIWRGTKMYVRSHATNALPERGFLEIEPARRVPTRHRRVENPVNTSISKRNSALTKKSR